MNTTLYSHEKIGLLKQMLVNSTEAGKPSDYEIRVDDMKVVPRTNDIDQFDNHEDFITEETRKVVVLVYDGNSRRNVRYNYKLKEEKPSVPQQIGLGELEVEKIVSERLEQKLEQKEQKWKQEQIEKENKELKKKLSEADEHIDKLSAGIENLKSNRKAGDIQWAELIGAAGESILRRNTHLIAKVPGMSALAGVIEQDNKKQEQVESPKPEAEASFTMKKNETEEQEKKSELSEGDKDRLNVLKQLEQGFNKEQMNNLITLINVLVHNPKALEPCIMYAAEWKEKQQQVKQEAQTENRQEKKSEEKHEQVSEEDNMPEKNKSTAASCAEDDLVSNPSY